MRGRRIWRQGLVAVVALGLTLSSSGAGAHPAVRASVSAEPVPGLPTAGNAFGHSLEPFAGGVLVVAGETPATSRLWHVSGQGVARPVFAETPFDESSVSAVSAVGDRFYFSARNTGSSGSDLWIGDVAGNVTRLTDRDSASAFEADAHRVGDAMLLTRRVGLDLEVWRTDGTPAGTELVRLHRAPGAEPLDLRESAVAAGRLYYTVRENDGPASLWVTGADGETRELTRRIVFGASRRGVTGITALGDRVYFALDAVGRGEKLWRSAGTPASTKRVSRLGSGARYRNRPTSFAVAGRKLLFATKRPASRVWVSDGTTRGTRSFRAPVQISLDAEAVRGKVFFAGSTTATGPRDLVVSNGTKQGIRRLTAFPRRAGGVEYRSMVRSGDRLFFLARDGVHGSELWTSDGTKRGTRMVVDAYRTGDSRSEGLVAVSGRLWFTTETHARGKELWRVERSG